MQRPKVYTASKLHYAEHWLALTESWTEIEFTASWPLVYVTNKFPNNKTREAAEQFWVDDEQDLRAADFVIVYSEPKDVLMGALVEAGMCIALGKIVIVVGENPGYNTWQYHPQCHKADTLEDARAMVDILWHLELETQKHFRPEVKEQTQAVYFMKNFILDLDTNGYLDPERGVVESTFMPQEFARMCSLIGVEIAEKQEDLVD